MCLSFKLGIGLAVLAFATSAFATNIYFNYSGTGFTGSGVLTATDQGGGTYLVTGIITGEQNGLPFTGVEPNNGGAVAISGPYMYNDLVYVTSTPELDIWGVVLDWSGGAPINLEYDSGFNGGSYTLWNGIEYAINFQASTTPEPSTLLTLGSGLIGLAGLARKSLFS